MILDACRKQHPSLLERRGLDHAIGYNGSDVVELGTISLRVPPQEKVVLGRGKGHRVGPVEPCRIQFCHRINDLVSGCPDLVPLGKGK